MKKSENILVLGLGSMGRYLATRLSHEGHHVTVIEPKRELLNRADSALDARLICGDAMRFECWAEADAASMDYLIAVTDDDAVNLVAALIAERYGIKRKIVRSRAIEVWREGAVLSAEQLNIDLVIRPEELAAQEIARLLKMHAGNVLVNVGDGALQVLATSVSTDSPVANLLVKNVSQQFDESPFRIGCVVRDIETIVPHGDFQLLVGDRIYLVAKLEHISGLMELFEVKQENRRNVLIVGGGLIGARVAELVESSHSVTLLEQRELRAEELSHVLRKTECLHGDGSDRETLLHAGLLKMDSIVAATGDNEANIMTCVLAKRLLHTNKGKHRGEVKTIAMVKREDYLELASSMGTDVAANKKVLAANAVLQYIRRGHVLSVAHLHGCDAEVVELLADQGSPITKRPLYTHKELRGRVMIGAVHRETGWEVAVGSTQINAGDRVVCVCTQVHLGELQRLFLS